jgi:hypothetical protein
MSFLLKNHPDPSSIVWKFLDKETYQEIENILTDGVVFFEPFLVDQFFPQEMFDELVEICNSNKLENIDFSYQMNKWEEGVSIPQKFFDYVVEKVKELVGTQDIVSAYHMYAHHQITDEGRIPKLPLHIDWAPGSYMVDLSLGGNREWGFVAKYENFICKPNQAVICQPQFDFHYRPPWNSDDPNEYYQAIFFHLINNNHWCVPNDYDKQNRPQYLNDKYNFGITFRNSEVFHKFQNQRKHIFENIYIKNYEKLLKNNVLPPIPWNEIPTKKDANIHQKKGVTPKNKGDR